MVILSVQICVGLKVLKNWGLHPVNEIATIAEVIKQFAEQQMEGYSSSVFPDELQDQPFECYIAFAVSEVLLFGKYLKYCSERFSSCLKLRGTTTT